MTLYEVDLDKIGVEVKSVSRGSRKPKEDSCAKPKAPSKRKAEPTVDDVTPKKRTVRKPKAQPAPVLSEPIPEPSPEPTPEPSPEPIPEIKVESPKVEVKVEDAVKPLVEETKQKKPRAPRNKRDPEQAPVWFEKYVEGVKKEQSLIKNEKVPAKKAKEEAQEVASKSWKHGLTRNRVQNEVDGHMTRMYSMIFSK